MKQRQQDREDLETFPPKKKKFNAKKILSVRILKVGEKIMPQEHLYKAN